MITSQYNGASELLTPPHDGFVIDDPHNHEHLASCMSQLLDPIRRASCAQAARRTASQWTFEMHYKQLLEIFLEAAKRKRAA